MVVKKKAGGKKGKKKSKKSKKVKAPPVLHFEIPKYVDPKNLVPRVNIKLELCPPNVGKLCIEKKDTFLDTRVGLIKKWIKQHHANAVNLEDIVLCVGKWDENDFVTDSMKTLNDLGIVGDVTIFYNFKVNSHPLLIL